MWEIIVGVALGINVAIWMLLIQVIIVGSLIKVIRR